MLMDNGNEILLNILCLFSILYGIYLKNKLLKAEKELKKLKEQQFND
jgi:hypothetical protein